MLMKISEKVYIHIHTHLLNKIPTGLHISLNTRLEHLAGVYDDLPAHVGHYLQDLGSEGGQGVIRLFTDLSLSVA